MTEWEEYQKMSGQTEWEEYLGMVGPARTPTAPQRQPITIPDVSGVPEKYRVGVGTIPGQLNEPNIIGQMARFWGKDLPAKIDATFGVPQAGFDKGTPTTADQKTFENQSTIKQVISQFDRAALRGISGALGFIPSTLSAYGLGGEPLQPGAGAPKSKLEVTKELITSTAGMFKDASHQAAYTLARVMGKSPEDALRWGTTGEGLIEARREAVRGGFNAPESPIFAVLMGKGAVEMVSPKAAPTMAEQVKSISPRPLTAPTVETVPQEQALKATHGRMIVMNTKEKVSVPSDGGEPIRQIKEAPDTALRDELISLGYKPSKIGAMGRAELEYRVSGGQIGSLPGSVKRSNVVSEQTKPAEPVAETNTISTPNTTRKARKEIPAVETNISSLAIKTEAEAIASKLTNDFGDLPEYKTMNMGEQAKMALSLIESDPALAKRVAMGEVRPPRGLREASVYEAVKIRAIKDGDVETLRGLAVESKIPGRLSAYGQAIKAADSGLMDDPVRVMQDIAKVRQSYAERTGQKYSADVIAGLRKKLADAESALSQRMKQGVSKKAAYGSKNKIVTIESYNKAKAALEGYLTTASSGVNPDALVQMTKIGTYHLEAGTRAFADWSAKMVEDAGEKIKPYLNDIWNRIQEDKKVQASIRAQKTRLRNETNTYEQKLTSLDLSKKEKRTIPMDDEARQLKRARDAAKKNYEAAVNASGSVTKEEAANIVSLSSRMAGKLSDMKKGGSRFEYGAARVAYENYINNLKGEQAPLSTIVKGGVQKFQTTWRENRSRAIYESGVDAFSAIVNNSVSMVASLDNSFIGRQGLHTLMTHPRVWANGARNSFVDMAKSLGGKNAHDALMADIYSRENYLNGSYEKAGILAKVEEQYPTSIPERIPGVGRVFKASESAFTGSAIRMRTGLYDLLSDKASKSGVDMSDPANIRPLGKMINSLTARGQWGKKGEPAVVRLVMWAPKMLKGNIDVLTAHGGGIGLESPFARREAAINLLKIVSETATVMAIANALRPGSVELDPRSSDFGKIRIGNTRYDITGGAAGVVTLASRLMTQSYKSTKTGEVKKYGIGFGQPTAFDALTSFISNKSNPPARVAIDWLRGRDFENKPFSFPVALYRAQTPISIQQAIKLKDDASANAVAGVILDVLGVNASTYQNNQTNVKLKSY